MSIPSGLSGYALTRTDTGTRARAQTRCENRAKRRKGIGLMTTRGFPSRAGIGRWLLPHPMERRSIRERGARTRTVPADYVRSLAEMPEQDEEEMD
eukprot:4807862-Amphidinium_carterae.1